jgi:hypothetical protein
MMHNMKFDHKSRPAPRTSPVANSRRVVTAHAGLAAPGHNVGSRIARRKRKYAIGDPANGLTLKAPGAGGPPLTGGIGPGGPLGTT